MIKVTEHDWREYGEVCGSYYLIEKDGEEATMLWTDWEVSTWLEKNVLPDEFVEWK